MSNKRSRRKADMIKMSLAATSLDLIEKIIGLSILFILFAVIGFFAIAFTEDKLINKPVQQKMEEAAIRRRMRSEAYLNTTTVEEMLEYIKRLEEETGISAFK